MAHRRMPEIASKKPQAEDSTSDRAWTLVERVTESNPHCQLGKCQLRAVCPYIEGESLPLTCRSDRGSPLVPARCGTPTSSFQGSPRRGRMS